MSLKDVAETAAFLGVIPFLWGMQRVLRMNYSESRERGPPGPRASRRAIDQTREQGVQAPRREEGWEVSLV